MKLLVTGGAGFIGSNFIKYWLAKYLDDEVVNLDKLTYAGNPENLKELEEKTNYRFLKKDVCDRDDEMNKVVMMSDAIVHFAAESHVDRSIESADEFIRTNVFGTNNLLQYAKEHGKRFHHVSTDEVFGSLDLNSSRKFSEDTAYDPRNPYAASKAGADHLVRSYYNTYGVPVTISNCSNNFGPNQNTEKFLAKTITNLLDGKKVPVYGRGENIRDWLFVEDHCRAIDLILKKGKIGETYCVGGMTDGISNMEVVTLILSLMGLREDMIEFVPDRPGHDLKYDINWSKISRDLGYKPECDFETYLKRTIAWYELNKSWWQNK
jgi:dTDP-glucose 4,6-dehydratase